ncbi:MAG: DsbA family protein [Vagococcus sp.]|uniref:DsbA family protein n=1 Tax=Vagococcus sp. TaxID=1933889 RepID=UPI002FC98139
MIEIYLFINPLDKSSLQSEKKYLDLISKETNKIHFRMIPILNPRVIQNYLLTHQLPTSDLEYRNQLFNTIYSACLDLKAVQLQGKQLGRKFLFELQKRVGSDYNRYSNELVVDILHDLKINVDLFKADRESKLIIDFFKIDQQIGHEMGIESFTDAVIFNYNCDRDFGVLVEDNTPHDIIQDLFKTDYNCTDYSSTSDNDRLHLH